MLVITLHDLRYRARQFSIAIVGAGLVFAMALLLTGLAASFSAEVDRTIGAIGADAYVVPEGTSGPFTSFAAMPATTVDAVAALPGVERAEPLVIVQGSAILAEGAKSKLLRLIGHEPGGMGDEAPTTGRRATAAGEAVADERLGAGLGERFTLAGHEFTVVGVVHGRTLLGGGPNVYVSVADAQATVFERQPLVTTVITRGVPRSLPEGLAALSADEVRADTLRVMKDATASVENSRALMWVVAAVIVAALVYVSTLERLRDFAVLKSLGSSSAAVFASVAVQAVLVALAAGALAAVTARWLKPIFALPLAIPTSAYVVLPIIAVVVGLLASLVALRRALSIDPSQAFAGA